MPGVPSGLAGRWNAARQCGQRAGLPTAVAGTCSGLPQPGQVIWWSDIGTLKYEIPSTNIPVRERHLVWDLVLGDLGIPKGRQPVTADPRVSLYLLIPEIRFLTPPDEVSISISFSISASSTVPVSRSM